MDPPQVSLSLGSSLRPEDIKEGDDVYFECQVKANPREHRISWMHEVSHIITPSIKLLKPRFVQCLFSVFGKEQ
ncbi:hypothetical protein J437_LFUL012500 [Ladona fulva]|uniref:Ig-like domain-containing protein n=1 Tax=Ladona fulva TaxID=123851 RepID=A0A8K0P485_LADFU|nr:hypothetical protein J437_LFUL012500 [Ladona fulva]